MNSVAQRQEPINYYLEGDHTEELARICSSITMFDPVKTAISYLLPWVGAWLSNQVELRKGDRLQEMLLTSRAKTIAFDLVRRLKETAEIEGDVALYTSLNYRCSSYGGTFSLGAPIISVPLYFLTKHQVSIFEGAVEENPEEPPEAWNFNSDEVTFLIAWEMAHIKSNDALLRIASKTLLVASLFFFFTMPAPVLVSSSLIVAIGVLYLILERQIHAKLDIEAVNILIKYFGGDTQKAVGAAASALEKLINQNITRKEWKSWWNGFYLTKSGNNLLDLDHPFLTNRLKRVREHFNVVPVIYPT